MGCGNADTARVVKWGAGVPTGVSVDCGEGAA